VQIRRRFDPTLHFLFDAYKAVTDCTVQPTQRVLNALDGLQDLHSGGIWHWLMQRNVTLMLMASSILFIVQAYAGEQQRTVSLKEVVWRD
jgi:hypothetical protein